MPERPTWRRVDIARIATVGFGPLWKALVRSWRQAPESAAFLKQHAIEGGGFLEQYGIVEKYGGWNGL